MSQQKFKGSKIETVSFKRIFINSVVPNAPLLYPCKHQKTVGFSNIFRGQRKGGFGTNGLTQFDSV